MYRCLCLFFLFTSFFFAQKAFADKHDIVTGTYIVNGVCEQCKKRIEDAAYGKGVKYAGWDVATHNLTVKYDSTKTSSVLILKSIAKAGHDSDDFKAEDEDYNKLPACCRYRSGLKKH